MQALFARCPQSNHRHAEEETFLHCWSPLPCERSYREPSSSPVGPQPRQPGACFRSSLVQRAPSVSAPMGPPVLCLPESPQVACHQIMCGDIERLASKPSRPVLAWGVNAALASEVTQAGSTDSVKTDLKVQCQRPEN